jgi:23S rRNA (guanosine2251-2'-O)-methyltransferase
VVAQAEPLKMPQFIDEALEGIEEPPLLLILDGVQDPHNLGACLRVADGAGAHAVIAPKDRSVGLTTTAIKVASGRRRGGAVHRGHEPRAHHEDLKDRGIWLIGADDRRPRSIYKAKLDGALGHGARRRGRGPAPPHQGQLRLLVSIPMLGSVESLNVSVASGVCLYEARRRRLK